MCNFGINNREVLINLASVDGHPIQIDTKGKLKFPQYFKFFFWRIKRSLWGLLKPCYLEGDYQYEIEILGAGGLELSKEVNPIEIQINNSVRAAKGSFRIDNQKEIQPFLYFFPKSIIDCSEKLTKEQKFRLDFSLKIISSQNCYSKPISDHLCIRIARFESFMDFELCIDEDKKSLMYNLTDNDVKIGKLIVRHNSSKECAPDIIHGSFNIFVKNIDEKNGEKINELVIMGEGDTSDKYKLSEAYTRLEIAELEHGEEIEIPLIWKMNKVSNPSKDVNYHVYIKCDDKEPKDIGSIQLKRNEVLVIEKVEFHFPGNMDESKPSDITIVNSVKGEIRLFEGMYSNPWITFSNTADSIDPKYPDASVLFGRCKITDVKIMETSQIKWFNEETKPEDLFKLSTEKDGDWDLSTLQQLKAKETKSVYIHIMGDLIKSIEPMQSYDETFVLVEITISYVLRKIKTEPERNQAFLDFKDGKDTGCYTRTIQLKLSKEPMKEWFCVDFGTSAVFAFSADARGNGESIDLKKTKEDIAWSIYKDKAKRDDKQESGTLIASTVVLNGGSSKAINYQAKVPSDYKDEVIWFSPTSGSTELKFKLPCLKTMMGYKYVPDIFEDAEKQIFKYKDTDNNELGLYDNEKKPTKVLEVAQVFESVYRQFFIYFLKNKIKEVSENDYKFEERRIEKLVLTHPNTYTPLNIDVLRKLARTTMPTVYPEHLLFISESDAVACYYLSKRTNLDWGQINPTQKKSLDNKEKVLVYDMGAGTLDLTYFIKEKNENNFTIDIIGKLGVNKAGNYLDYVIAQILVELYKNNNGKELKKLNRLLLIDKKTAKGLNVILDERDQLKNYVKELKAHITKNNLEEKIPKLQLGNQDEFDFEEAKIKDIVNHELFKKFINEITCDVLKSFADNCGENGVMDIDLVILSGRSTCLYAIREGLKAYIDKNNENLKKLEKKEKKTLYFNICSGKVSEEFDSVDALKLGKLKSVVAEGALAYATQYKRKDSGFTFHFKHLYATIGIIIHKSNEEDQWIPLIGPNSNHIEDDNYINNSTKLERKGVVWIDLVQSYVKNPISAIKNQSTGMISKLCEIHRTEWPENFTIQIKMYKIRPGNNANSLELRIADQTVDLNPHDDFDDESLRKSLWPVIFPYAKSDIGV